MAWIDGLGKMFEFLLVITLISGCSVGSSEHDFRMNRDGVNINTGTSPYCNYPLGMENGYITDQQINATSYFIYYDVFLPHKARLNGLSAWCAFKLDTFQILEINLGDSHIITGVSTQGRHAYNEWVTSFSISYNNDDTKSWIFILDNQGLPKNFSGNWDSRTIHTNYFEKSIIANRIRILPKSWVGWISMRVELLGCLKEGECKYPLGMEDGGIANRQLTASSFYSTSYTPSKARLNGLSAWCPKKLDDSQFLEIYIGGPQLISGVAVQGRRGSKEWVTSFIVSYRNPESTRWLVVLDNEGFPKNFSGNRDSKTIMRYYFDQPVVANKIRILPKTWIGWISMRLEILGCLRESICTYPLGLKNGDVTNQQLIASSYYESTGTCGPHNARLNGLSSWCSYVLDDSQYLEVIFWKLYTISGISTQGRSRSKEWVSSYTVSYNNPESDSWLDIMNSKGGPKIFHGNRNSRSIKTNYFNTNIVTNGIRIHPKTWNTWISMRIELYGCLKEVVG